MPELEAQLSALAPAIAWPDTPRFAVPAPVQPRRVGWARTLALAAAAVVVVAAALLAFPPTRDAIASWLNLHTIIHRVQTLPTPSPRPSGSIGQRLGLGSPTTLTAAQADVQWKIAVPASLGQPAEVYYQAPPVGPSQGEVTLVYASPTTILVTEARGKVEEQFFFKMLGPEAKVEQVTVSGRQGFWISGAPHGFVFVDSNGEYRTETFRLATNTLIFDDGGTIVRIEGDLTKAQAIAIAASLGT